MNTDQKIIKNKVGLLNLAEMLGSVSEALSTCDDHWCQVKCGAGGVRIYASAAARVTSFQTRKRLARTRR